MLSLQRRGSRAPRRAACVRLQIPDAILPIINLARATNGRIPINEAILGLWTAIGMCQVPRLSSCSPEGTLKPQPCYQVGSCSKATTCLYGNVLALCSWFGRGMISVYSHTGCPLSTEVTARNLSRHNGTHSPEFTNRLHPILSSMNQSFAFLSLLLPTEMSTSKTLTDEPKPGRPVSRTESRQPPTALAPRETQSSRDSTLQFLASPNRLQNFPPEPAHDRARSVNRFVSDLDEHGILGRLPDMRRLDPVLHLLPLLLALVTADFTGEYMLFENGGPDHEVAGMRHDVLRCLEITTWTWLGHWRDRHICCPQMTVMRRWLTGMERAQM